MRWVETQCVEAVRMWGSTGKAEVSWSSVELSLGLLSVELALKADV